MKTHKHTCHWRTNGKTDVMHWTHSETDSYAVCGQGALHGWKEAPSHYRKCAQCSKELKYVKPRLEYLRGELRAECISYGELSELQSLVAYIEPDDIELLQAAGVEEHKEE